MASDRPSEIYHCADIFYVGHRYWWHSPIVIAVVKCSLAYLVASLFTFVPVLAAILSTGSETDAHGRITRKPAYSAHMVATIVVYVSDIRILKCTR